MQIQFLQDVTSMSLDGVEANIKIRCDFFVCLAFGQELQDFSFASSKQVIAVYRAFLFENAYIVLCQDAANLGLKNDLFCETACMAPIRSAAADSLSK